MYAAADLSIRYINDRYLPDKAIDLLDEACARKRIGGKIVAAESEFNETSRQLLSTVIDSALQSGDIDKAKEKYDLIISNFPKSQSATSSKTKLAEINNAGTGKTGTANSADDSDNTGN